TVHACAVLSKGEHLTGCCGSELVNPQFLRGSCDEALLQAGLSRECSSDPVRHTETTAAGLRGLIVASRFCEHMRRSRMDSPLNNPGFAARRNARASLQMPRRSRPILSPAGHFRQKQVTTRGIDELPMLQGDLNQPLSLYLGARKISPRKRAL